MSTSAGAVVGYYTSSSGTKTYTLRRLEDGTLTCDCPGWTFKRPGKERRCKHIDLYAVEGPQPFDLKGAMAVAIERARRRGLTDG